MKSMTLVKKFALANSVACVLFLLVFCLLSLNRFNAAAFRDNNEDLGRCLQTFRELLHDKGAGFSIADDTLWAGRYPINGNFEVPDKVREIFGGTATVFMGDRRISTNVRQKDGRRAVGTRLEGAAYRAIFLEGKPFRGETDVLGVPYLTAYDPIRDHSGRVIGALYVGLKTSEFMDHRNGLMAQMALILIGLSVSFITFSLVLNNLTTCRGIWARAGRA